MASSSSVEPVIPVDIVSSSSSEDGDDDSSSWVDVEKTVSTLTGPGKQKLEALCNKYRVPHELYTPRMAGTKPACAAPEEGRNEIVVYADALDAGMRLPLHGFYVELLRHYGLSPSQLAPNSWRYMAAFVLLCEDARVQPMVSVFQYFFTLCNYSGKYKKQQQGSGPNSNSARAWHHHFRPYCYFPKSSSIHSGRPGPLFTGRIPIYPRSWKRKFFVLRSSVPWPCSVHGGEPRKEAMCRPIMTAEAMAVAEKMLQKSIAVTAGTGIDMMSFLSNRALPVGGISPPEEEATDDVVEDATRKRKASKPEPATPHHHHHHHDDGGQPPSNVVVSGGEGSSTRGLFDLVQNAMAELQEKEEALQASKTQVVQLKLELELKEAYAKELEKANAAHSAELARLADELHRASATHEAELQAVKVQFRQHKRNIRRQIISLLPEEEAEELVALAATGDDPAAPQPAADGH